MPGVEARERYAQRKKNYVERKKNFPFFIFHAAQGIL